VNNHLFLLEGLCEYRVPATNRRRPAQLADVVINSPSQIRFASAPRGALPHLRCSPHPSRFQIAWFTNGGGKLVGGRWPKTAKPQKVPGQSFK